MDVRLVIVRGAKGRPTYRMRGSELLIGRQKGCGIRIPASTVSRQHCRLRLVKETLVVEDLGSANGTKLNDAMLEEETMVQPGDELIVGPITFRVEYQLTTAARRKQPAPVVENSDFEMVEAESAEDESTVKAELLEEDTSAPLPMFDEDADQAEFLNRMGNEDGKPLDLPEGDELRSLLSQLEDDTPQKPKKSKR